MTTPRSQLVDNEIALHYHLMSRCVKLKGYTADTTLTEPNVDAEDVQLAGKVNTAGVSVRHEIEPRDRGDDECRLRHVGAGVDKKTTAV